MHPGATPDDARMADIRKFIEESFAGSSRKVDDDERLLGEILDSIGVLTLANHLEDTYGISIGPHEMDPANFGTVRSIAAFVTRKTSAT